MPRILSIPVWRLVRPAASSRAMTSGTPSMVSQRSWTCWRVVMSATFRPESGGDLAEEPSLRRADDAVGHADPHHEVPGRGPAVKHARPLEPLLVVVGDASSSPSRAKRARSSRTSRPSFSCLERLDLVHRPRLRGNEPEAHRAAFSSGCVRERVAGGQREVVGRPCKSRSGGPSGRAGSRCPRGWTR